MAKFPHDLASFSHGRSIGFLNLLLFQELLPAIKTFFELFRKLKSSEPFKVRLTAPAHRSLF